MPGCCLPLFPATKAYMDSCRLVAMAEVCTPQRGAHQQDLHLGLPRWAASHDVEAPSFSWHFALDRPALLL